MTPFVGRYGSRFDLRVLASLSFLAMGLVSFYRAGFTTQVAFGDIAWAQFWQGLGVALFFMPVLTILLSDLETREIASGSGVATFLRTLAGSFAASLTTYIWDRGAAVQHAVLGQHVNVYSPATRAAVSQLTQVTGSTQGAYAVLNQAVSAQGFMVSTIDLFWMLGWLFLGLIGVMWFAKPPFVAKTGGAAAGGH
jgi:DHA2 family multidrug resistance protein